MEREEHELGAEPRSATSDSAALVDWLLAIGMGLAAGGAMYLAIIVRTSN